MEHTDTLCGQNGEFGMLKRVVHAVTIGLLKGYFRISALL
jgi:hypothetical protein